MWIKVSVVWKSVWTGTYFISCTRVTCSSSYLKHLTYNLLSLKLSINDGFSIVSYPYSRFQHRIVSYRIVSILKVSASDRTSSTLNPLCCVASRRFKPLTPRRLVSSCFLFPEYGGNEHGEIKGTEI